jgi:leucyl-tRNA---protein transferase
MYEFENRYTCGYLPGHQTHMKYFIPESSLNEEELNDFISKGWRKFGRMFFRPICENCQKCIPLRVNLQKYQHSKKFRALLRKNANITVKINSLTYSEEIYAIYLNHSQRFPENIPDSEENFRESFFQPACHGIQSEFYLNDELIAIGFLDVASEGLSSVYFIYKNEYSDLRLGTFGALKEIEYAQQLGKHYYYLGFYIKECSRMVYKNHFKPNEHMNWQNMQWEPFSEE